jgi:RNA polymerase sigma-70 factor (ECF subfamily)
MKKRMNAGEQRRVFDEWLSSHKGLLFKVVRAYAFSPHDRDDLFQEISVQMWNSIPNYRGESGAATWIYRVALYTAIAWTRREKKHHEGKQPLTEAEHTLTETIKFKDSRLEWLYDQIGQLNEIDRSLTLLLLDGFSYKEMAAILGISESNVGVKINRIKKRLTQKSREVVDHGI